MNPFDVLTPYDYEELTAHLRNKGRFSELHEVLSYETSEGRNAWYEIKQRLGAIADFVSDVETAQKHARESGRHDLDVRYTLVRATLGELAQRLPPVLIGALVRAGLWDAQRMRAYCRKIPSARSRCDTYNELLPFLEGDDLKVARDEALAEASHDGTVEALVTLAQLLPTEERHRALAAARSDAFPLRRAEKLTGLVPHLNGAERDQAVTEALDFWLNPKFGEAASGTIRANDLLTQSREGNERDSVARRRSQGITQLLPYLDPRRHSAATRVALDVVETIGDENIRLTARAAIAPKLRGLRRWWTIRRLLAVADSNRDSAFRAEILTALAPALNGGARRRALAILDRMPPSRSRAEAWAALLPRGADSRSADRLATALIECASITNTAVASQTMEGLLPLLDEALFEDAGRMAELRLDPAQQVRFFLAMARRAGRTRERAALVERALGAARRIKARAPLEDIRIPLRWFPGPVPLSALRSMKTGMLHDARAEALARVASHMPAAEARAVLTEAIEGAVPIGDHVNRAMASGLLARHAPVERRATLADAALALASKIDDVGLRAVAMAMALPALEEDRRAKVATQTESLAVAKLWPSGYEALCLLAPSLPGKRRRKRLSKTYRQLKDEQNPLMAAGGNPARRRIDELVGAESANVTRAELMAHLASCMGPGRSLDARTETNLDVVLLAYTTKDPSSRALAHAVILPYLGEDARLFTGLAIKSAKDITDIALRARAVEAIASALEGSDRHQFAESVWEQISHFECAHCQIQMRGAIGLFRPHPDFVALINDVLSLEDPTLLVRSLERLVDTLVDQATDEQRRTALTAILDKVAAGLRADAMLVVGRLGPLIASVASEAQRAQACSAVLDVGRLWP